jgi:hypothetical protein
MRKFCNTVVVSGISRETTSFPKSAPGQKFQEKCSFPGIPGKPRISRNFPNFPKFPEFCSRTGIPGKVHFSGNSQETPNFPEFPEFPEISRILLPGRNSGKSGVSRETPVSPRNCQFQGGVPPPETLFPGGGTPPSRGIPEGVNFALGPSFGPENTKKVHFFRIKCRLPLSKLGC